MTKNRITEVGRTRWASRECLSWLTSPVRMVLKVRTLVPARGVSGRPAGEVTQLAMSPCSPQVAAGHADGTVRTAALRSFHPPSHSLLSHLP